MHTDCLECFHKQADKLFEKFSISVDDSKMIISKFDKLLGKEGIENIQAPEAARFLHNEICNSSLVKDLYETEKKTYNRLMLSLEKKIKNNIRSSGNAFYTALRYALAGNIIDFGPPGAFDVYQALEAAESKKPAVDHSSILFNEIYKADTVLYLGDNAGEIVTDKLFIETIGHPNLYFAVRGGHIINDVTMDDAEATGMHKITKVISNGYDAPSTILNKCSKEFKKIYDKADIIISKGQGNLEGLINETNKRIFFLLTVKCHVMAELVGVNEKDTVVWYNRKRKNDL